MEPNTEGGEPFFVRGRNHSGSPRHLGGQALDALVVGTAGEPGHSGGIENLLISGLYVDSGLFSALRARYDEALGLEVPEPTGRRERQLSEGWTRIRGCTLVQLPHEADQ